MALPFLSKIPEKPANQIVPKTSRKSTHKEDLVNQVIESQDTACRGVELLYYGACYMW